MAGQLQTMANSHHAYLGEDIQLAHDVLQRAGQCLGHAGGLLGPAPHGLRTPVSASWDGESHLWLKTMKGKAALS